MYNIISDLSNCISVEFYSLEESLKSDPVSRKDVRMKGSSFTTLGGKRTLYFDSLTEDELEDSHLYYNNGHLILPDKTDIILLQDYGRDEYFPTSQSSSAVYKDLDSIIFPWGPDFSLGLIENNGAFDIYLASVYMDRLRLYDLELSEKIDFSNLDSKRPFDFAFHYKNNSDFIYYDLRINTSSPVVKFDIFPRILENLESLDYLLNLSNRYRYDNIMYHQYVDKIYITMELLVELGFSYDSSEYKWIYKGYKFEFDGVLTIIEGPPGENGDCLFYEKELRSYMDKLK